MRTFSRTSQFKKDVKLAGRRGKNLSKLKAVFDLLIEGEVLPPQYKDHPLPGNVGATRRFVEPQARRYSFSLWFLCHAGSVGNGAGCVKGLAAHEMENGAHEVTRPIEIRAPLLGAKSCQMRWRFVLIRVCLTNKP